MHSITAIKEVGSQQGAERSVRRAALLIAVISGFMIPFVSSAVTISLPAIGRQFESDTILLGWVRTAYLLTGAMFLLPFGRIADIFGRKRIMRAGISVYTLASLVCAVSSSTQMLIVARALQGIGSSMVFGTAVAILSSVYPSDVRGKAIGIRVAFVYLGASSGPSLGGFLAQNFGWRSIFVVNFALGVVIIALLTWRLKGEWMGASGEKFDLPGAVLSCASLFLIVYGILELADNSGFLFLCAGLFGLGCFLWHERNVKSPLLDVGLFRRNRVFVLSVLASFLMNSSIAAKGFLMSFYLQAIMGLDPQWAGLVLLAQPAVQVAISPFAGRLSDKRIEPRYLSSAGMAASAFALFLMSFFDADTSLLYVVCSLSILGLGIALFSSPNTNAIMGSVTKRSYSIASAVHSTMTMVGMNLSMGIAMILLSIHIGKVQLEPAHHADFLLAQRTAFSIFAGICIIGAIVSLTRGNVRGQNARNDSPHSTTS